MEPVSFTVGVVALAGLFSTCVECWEYIESARSYGRVYDLLATRLEVEKIRYLIWGDVVGVLKPSNDGRDEVLDQPRIAPIVEQILNHIISIFSDSETLISKYGIGQAKLGSAEPQEVMLSANQLSRYKISYQQFLARVGTAQQRISLFGKTRWAIRDRKKFGILVEELRQLVDSLKDITESPTNGVQQRQQNAIAEEIESLPDLSVVRLIKDATAAVHQDWSDAATGILEMSILGSEDKEDILSWIKNTADLDLGDQAPHETLLEAGLDINAPGFEYLHWAAIYDYDHVVLYLLDHGVDVDARNSELQSPLLQAAHANNTDVIQLLIDRGANLEARGSDWLTPLHVATNARHPKTVKMLLRYSVRVDCRDQYHRTPLIRAAQLGDLNIMQLLLVNGAKVEAQMDSGATALHEAVRVCHEKAVLLLLKWGANIESLDRDAATPLLNASKNGRTEMVQLLLEQGADIEASGNDGFRALHWTAMEGYTALLGALLAKGANLEAGSGMRATPLLQAALQPSRPGIIRHLLQYRPDLEARDSYGYTALIRAAMTGDENTKVLLEGGSLADARDHSGSTAIMRAAEHGRASIVRILVANGADITLADESGRNILHIVTKMGYLEIARILIQLGRIEIDQRDFAGDTALMGAAMNGHRQTVKLLLQNGASKEIANDTGETPIVWATRKGHIRVMRLLSGSAD